MSARPVSLEIVNVPSTSEVPPKKSSSLEVAVGYTGDDERDKRSSEQPFIDDKEITVDIVHGKSKDPDASSLPLPERPSKYYKDYEDAPSMFPFPCARIRYAWNHSSNLLEFLTRAVCIVFASFGWLVVVGGIPFLSIAEIVIGSMYLHDCKAQPLIPEYLIVAGVVGTLLHAIAVRTKYASKHRTPESEVWRKRYLCLEACLQIFLTVWFFAGCFWVYTIYEPEYTNVLHHGYCHKTVYLFAFWMLNITFIILILFFTTCICCITFIAMGSDKVAG